jgi:hypothetical protein
MFLARVAVRRSALAMAARNATRSRPSGVGVVGGTSCRLAGDLVGDLIGDLVGDDEVEDDVGDEMGDDVVAVERVNDRVNEDLRGGVVPWVVSKCSVLLFHRGEVFLFCFQCLFSMFIFNVQFQIWKGSEIEEDEYIRLCFKYLC